jgi:hypothetical protein
MAGDSLGFARDIPVQAMRNRPVAVSDRIWQTRLQRSGSPLRDYIEYRVLHLLTPSAPAVAVVIHQSGQYVDMAKEFRRQDVLKQGHLIGVTLMLPAPGIPFLRSEPTSERCWERELRCPGSLWRTAMPQERPDATAVFLTPGTETVTGEVIDVAAIGPRIRMAMLLVDLDDVKGLRAGRWRLRKATAVRGSTWQILGTGARTQHMRGLEG